MREFELIRWIAEHTPGGDGLVTGIGDDCAVVRTRGGDLVVVTTDMLLEGTHFTRDDDPADIGEKALAVSISDVAAMGCKSQYAFLAVGLPAGFDPALATGMLEGALAAARRYGVLLAGGDTTASPGGITICSTLLGAPPEGRMPVLRGGASAGEVVAVTGRLGGSRSGRHLRFTPRQEEALELVGAHAVGAMIDISDGLSSDAWHVARASGVGLRLYRDRIPISSAADPGNPIRAAFDDGEDFELLFTVSRSSGERLSREGLAGTAVTVIGEVVAGEPGVGLVDAEGRETELSPGGYEHFSD